jgi:hypothetical protein
MNEEYKKVLKAIIEKNKDRKSIWLKTSGNGFKILLSGNAIAISLILDGISDNEGYHYNLIISNNQGETVYNYRTHNSRRPSDNEFALLESLYDSAQNVYYKVDETFKSIFNNVTSMDTIGEDPDDNLPF